ncbi:hypothetical protein [Mycolicibacterium sp.]|uniref:hypothetical protein n=1 Tax=Mycolicibacterium sp. TaxID=2320850 RepID=UPI0037C8DDE1
MMNTEIRKPRRRAHRLWHAVAAVAVAIGLGAGAAAAPASATPVTSAAQLPAAPVLAPAPTGWAADTGQFAFCLGGFGFVAAPIVAGFMFGGPNGAANAAKAWFPRLGPAGDATLKSCMWSIFHVRV